jgi:hypothetical protein
MSVKIHFVIFWIMTLWGVVGGCTSVLEEYCASMFKVEVFFPLSAYFWPVSASKGYHFNIHVNRMATQPWEEV